MVSRIGDFHPEGSLIKALAELHEKVDALTASHAQLHEKVAALSPAPLPRDSEKQPASPQPGEA